MILTNAQAYRCIIQVKSVSFIVLVLLTKGFLTFTHKWRRCVKSSFYVAMPLKCRFLKVTRLIFDWEFVRNKNGSGAKNTANDYYQVVTSCKYQSSPQKTGPFTYIH